MKDMPWRLGNVFPWAIAAAFVPMFLVVRHFEEARVFDSIGTWYTVVVAVVFSALIGAVVAAAVLLVKAQANRHRGSTDA